MVDTSTRGGAQRLSEGVGKSLVLHLSRVTFATDDSIPLSLLHPNSPPAPPQIILWNRYYKLKFKLHVREIILSMSKKGQLQNPKNDKKQNYEYRQFMRRF